jgi:hypothetical protein
MNNGSGALSSPTVARTGFHHELAAADMDGDGDIDLLCSENYRYVLPLLNPGNGSFPEAPSTDVSTVLRQVLPGDMDGDGDVDLALLSNVDLIIKINSGAGSFSAARHPATNLTMPPPGTSMETVIRTCGDPPTSAEISKRRDGTFCTADDLARPSASGGGGGSSLCHRSGSRWPRRRRRREKSATVDRDLSASGRRIFFGSVSRTAGSGPPGAGRCQRPQRRRFP